MRIARFCMDSMQLFSLCAGNSIVPNRSAVLEDRPYNCHVEMQDLLSGNTRPLKKYNHPGLKSVV